MGSYWEGGVSDGGCLTRVKREASLEGNFFFLLREKESASQVEVQRERENLK